MGAVSTPERATVTVGSCSSSPSFSSPTSAAQRRSRSQDLLASRARDEGADHPGVEGRQPADGEGTKWRHLGDQRRYEQGFDEPSVGDEGMGGREVGDAVVVQPVVPQQHGQQAARPKPAGQAELGAHQVGERLVAHIDGIPEVPEGDELAHLQLVRG